MKKYLVRYLSPGQNLVEAEVTYDDILPFIEDLTKRWFIILDIILQGDSNEKYCLVRSLSPEHVVIEDRISEAEGFERVKKLTEAGHVILAIIEWA